jgi:hypothetical protein
MIGQKVKVYRNLKLAEGGFSIKGKDSEGKERVLGYSKQLILKNVTFTGGHAPIQRRIQFEGASKEVHAYAVGTLMSVDEFPSCFLDGLIEVTYRPRERAGFFIVDSGAEVTSSDAVCLINNKMYCKNPR